MVCIAAIVFSCVIDDVLVCMSGLPHVQITDLNPNLLPPYVSTGRNLEGPCTVIPAVLLPLIVSDTKSWIGIVLTAAVPALLDRIPEYKHRDP